MHTHPSVSLPNRYLKVSGGGAGNHNCRPPIWGCRGRGTIRVPGKPRPGWVREQDTSAVGGGGAQEAVWASSLREGARAAWVGELCQPKPGRVPGTRRPQSSPRSVPCWSKYRLCPQQATEMSREDPPHLPHFRILGGPAYSSWSPVAHSGSPTDRTPGLCPSSASEMKASCVTKTQTTHPGARPTGDAWGVARNPRKGQRTLCLTEVRPSSVQPPAGWEPRAHGRLLGASFSPP